MDDLYQTTENPSKIDPEILLLAKIIFKTIEDYQKKADYYYKPEIYDERKLLFEDDNLEYLIYEKWGLEGINCDYIRRMAKDRTWMKSAKKRLFSL